MVLQSPHNVGVLTLVKRDEILDLVLREKSRHVNALLIEQLLQYFYFRRRERLAPPAGRPRKSDYAFFVGDNEPGDLLVFDLHLGNIKAVILAGALDPDERRGVELPSYRLIAHSCAR